MESGGKTFGAELGDGTKLKTENAAESWDSTAFLFQQGVRN